MSSHSSDPHHPDRNPHDPNPHNPHHPDPDHLDLDPDPEFAGGAPVATDRFPGFWERRRLLKRIEPTVEDGQAIPARLIEIDLVIASRAEWLACEERHEPGWDVIDLAAGLILAERTLA